jgi:hypothetical protein
LKARFAFPARQIHLDFHTSGAIGDVGTQFNAREFAAAMRRAHVNSVTVFAKCHHGLLYYNTARAERHPGLSKKLDLLGEQIEALHREGIRAPIYLSVQCDEYAADHYPQWIAQKVEGAPVRRPAPGMFEAGWQILDMSSPYQDYLAEQTQEVLQRFKPVDGIFFDMCWDQPSISKYSIAGLRKVKLNPESEADRAAYAKTVVRNYMKRFYRMVKAASPNATVYFNGRPLGSLSEELSCFTQVEIEALPTGGWGYLFFPRHVRFIRTLGKPYLGMTARFHKSWADFGGLKPYAALEYETSQMMAHGAACSVGDQLHPRGFLDAAAYDLIGKVYQRVEEREPWLDRATPVTQIGVLQTSSPGIAAEEGVTQILSQLKHQFNFIDHETDFDRYELLILPDATVVSEKTVGRLKTFLRGGKALLATGTSCLGDEGRRLLLPELGIEVEGYSPFTASYMRFGREILRGLPPGDHVMYDRSIRVRSRRGARSLATIVEPYFERAWDHFSSHFQTPPDRTSHFAGAVQNKNAGYIAWPIFSSYANHGNLTCRWLVERLINRLMPARLLTTNLPATGEATVMRQGGRKIVHLLYYSPQRRTLKLDIVEDIVPLHDVDLSLRLAKAPKSVYLAPARERLKFTWEDGVVRTEVPRIDGHAMVVFE